MVRLIGVIAILFFTVSGSLVHASESPEGDRHTIVIVHGATGGGWDWKTVAAKLTARGHMVYRPTLSGLGERHHLPHGDIDLTTHINDIVNVILFEELTDIILVGHSYGGMVITGVADRIPERIEHLTYLDAIVTEDGESAMRGQDFPPNFPVANGSVTFPWIDESAPFPRDVKHPVKTLTEPVSRKNPVALALDATFIAFVPEGQTLTEWKKGGFGSSWLTAEKRGWTMRSAVGDHVFYRLRPGVMADLIEASASDRKAE